MSNPWIGIPVLAFLAGAIIVTLWLLYRLAEGIRWEAREAQHTAAGVRAAREADGYTGELLAREPLALPPGPSARAAAAPPWELAASGPLPMLPGDEPRQLAPDETGVLPVVHAELGVPTTGEFVAIAFAEADAAAAAAWNKVIP